MKKFSISLNQSQWLFLASCLPKGYSFVKFKQNSNANHSKHDPQKIKSPADLKNNIERDPLTSSQELSSQSSNSHQSRLKHKGKNSKQSKESVPKEKTKSQLNKLQSPSQNSKSSQKVSILHKLLNQIEKKKSSSIFIEPVDPVKLQIPNYFDIIKRPMDIQTMRKKVKQGKYEEFSSFEEDLETIVSNCIKFNAGNNFFIQLAKKFSNEYKKVLQKFKEEINKNFKLQSADKSIESNSEQQTNSEDKVESKHQKKFKKIGLKVKKIEEKEEQNLKSPLCNQKKLEQDKQRLHAAQQKMQDVQKIQQIKAQNGIEKDENLIEKEEQQSTAKKLQKAKPKNEIKIKIKKYSYEDRLKIISRIKKLDRGTMFQFFKDINFSKGESLDFKVLQEEKIKQIEEKLLIYERIHQQRMKEATKQAQERKAKQDFEIEEDKDYED